MGCIHGLKNKGTNHGERQESGTKGAQGVRCEEGVPLFGEVAMHPH